MRQFNANKTNFTRLKMYRGAHILSALCLAARSLAASRSTPFLRRSARIWEARRVKAIDVATDRLVTQKAAVKSCWIAQVQRMQDGKSWCERDEAYRRQS